MITNHQVCEGTRVCAYCGLPYVYPFEGRRKYHFKCAALAKKEMDNGYWHNRKRPEPVENRDHEYRWMWACGTCGLKHEQQDEAINCCSDTWDGYEMQPYCKEGGYWISHAEMIEDVTLKMKGPQTTSRSHATSQEPNSVVHIAVTCESRGNYLRPLTPWFPTSESPR